MAIENTIKTLIADNEISLTVIDGTEAVSEGIKLHRIPLPFRKVYAKCLLFAMYLSVGLKEKDGEVSLSIKGSGAVRSVSVSGDADLYIRGYLDYNDGDADLSDPDRSDFVFAPSGIFTVIRSDGYSTPFVGVCEGKEGLLEENFERYFSESEQLPTRFCIKIELDEDGNLTSAILCGGALLPFASEKSKEFLFDGNFLKELSLLTEEERMNAIRSLGGENSSLQKRAVKYQCRCSREKITSVILSLGKEETFSLVEREGEINVHCDYCNKDYIFSVKEIKELFEEK